MLVRSPGVPSGSARAAQLLREAAIGVLILLAPVMVVANRSSLLLVVVAALLGGAAAWRDGALALLLGRLAAALATPLGRVVLAFAGWSLLSVLWSPFRWLSLAAWGEFWLPVAAALVLAETLPGAIGRRRLLLFAGSLAVAACLVLGDLASGLAIERLTGGRAVAYVLNRPVLTLLVLLPAALLVLGRGRRRSLAIGLAILVAVALRSTESGASVFGLLAGAAAAAIGGWSRRAGLTLAGLALAGTIATAPVVGEWANDLLPSATYQTLARAHSRDRVDIWTSFGAALRQAPVLGTGIGATARLDTAPVAASVDPLFAFFLGVGHPHSAALQVWTELGCVGAAIAAALLMLALREIARLDGAPLAAALAMVAAILAVSLVGQGAWQGWWPASIGAGIVWFRAVLAQAGTDTDRDPETAQ